MFENIESTLDFCKEIADWDREYEYKIIEFFFISFLPDFNKIYEQEKVKLPYHINLLDEIHANENAHSRILMKLLNANDSAYFILKSFLHHLGLPFSDLSLNNIEIHCEKERIDVCVLAKDFVLIIENKIYGAVDQPEQIYKYVRKVVEKHGFSQDKIFVLYLTKDGGKPSKDSLPRELEDELGNRYKSISYRNNILPWLESEVLPNCKIKDTYLTSAITQYIDNLKGMFHLRKFEKDMNEELKKHLIEKLNLEGKNLNKQIEEINAKEEEVNKILSYLQDLKTDKEKEKNIIWLKEINKKMKEDFSKYSPKFDDSLEQWPKSYFVFNVKNWPAIKLMIEIDQEILERPYYGIYVMEDNIKQDKISGLIQKLMENKDFSDHDEDDVKSPVWYWSRYSDYEMIYSEFNKLYQKLNELMK